VASGIRCSLLDRQLPWRLSERCHRRRILSVAKDIAGQGLVSRGV
jgi:hypothetical protein